MNQTTHEGVSARSFLRRLLRQPDLLVGLLLVIVGGLTFFFSRELPATVIETDVGAGAFPSAYAVILIGLAVLLIINSGVTSLQTDCAQGSPIRAVYGGAMTLVYILVMPWIGFLLSTPIFMFALMWLLGVRRIWLGGVIAISFTGLLYASFEIGMSVALPVGSLFE